KWSELETIGTLYFRELRDEVDNFCIACVQQGILNVEFAREVRRAANEAADPIGARQKAADSFRARWAILDKERQAAQDDLTSAARTLLERIMSVDEHPPSDER